MAKFEGELADVLSICPNCQYWQEYQKGGVSIEKMRENCALRCKQHPDLRNNKGIYKFDVVYAYLLYYLATLEGNTPPKKFIGKGRVGKAEERYGKAARALYNEGKNISQIASLLNISRPTVYKLLGNDRGDNL